MKKTFLTLTSLILILSVIMSSFMSCTESELEETQIGKEQETTAIEDASVQTERETVEESESMTAEEVTTGTETEKPVLEGEYATLIEHANDLKNGVQASFTDGSRSYFAIENAEMKLSYALKSDSKQLVSTLTNTDGKSYIAETMDVFVRMKDGNTYYASGSTQNATANLYRIGMYYYEARFEEQNFMNSPDLIDGQPLNDWSVDTNASHNIGIKDGKTVVIKNSSDPYVVLKNAAFSASEYNMLKIRLRPITGTKGTGTLYILAGGAGGFSPEQSVSFRYATNEEYQDIYIPLYQVTNYKGEVSKLRIDIDGNVGDSFELAEITPAKLGIEKSTPLYLNLCRSFYVYTDKMHHDVQIAATSTTKGIQEVGVSTTINADTVAGILIKDANATHTTLDSVDWETAQYVGFDIINAGIFGYILPVHENAGSIKVTLANGIYTVEQTRTPSRNAIEPSEEGTLNANDFHISQRIYTDENHSFDEFIREAEIERNPILKSIRVNNTEFTSATFAGYDPIRGIYVIDIDGFGTFNPPYFSQQNRYYTADIVVRSTDDRSIYLMTRTNRGSMECSVLLSKNNTLIPIPVAVCKNFSETAGERNLYNLDDDDYSESFFPVYLKADEKNEFTIANLYQNWGQYPLKQLSSIQFRAPYYHLSTGVTESNCILPWYETKRGGLNTLPDFRAMSAPLWEGQPQRNSGGAHTWLEYTDSDGNYSATENYADYIDSYGPTYADVTMHNISYDGRIKATYTHMEMPQTDENRTYYEIKYEVLEEIDIKDFKNNFTFYAVTDNEPAATADYRQIGYLNENNECVTTKSNLDRNTVKEYVLGKNCPYFSMFDMPADASPDGYTNVAFLVYNSRFVINGEENDASFIIINSYNKINLSLDLGDVTLKKGDSFTINAILMPWGSHESDYTDGDVNVRAVRENTILNPLTITSDTDTVLESVYVPKVRSTDGLTATFTLKDGYNNVAVRAYGFTKLTVPTLYEYINDEWVKVELSSSAKPDTSGYYHYFDGYMVHYDGDGTYSYSFVTEMNNGDERLFKLDLSEDVASLPDSGKREAPNYLDIYYDPAEIDTLIGSSANYANKFSNKILSSDQSYISLYGNNVLESFFMITPEKDEISGQYIVVKYRIPTSNTERFNNFEFYLSSTTASPTSGENLKYANIKQDGKWHVAVIDASTFNLPTFERNENGAYAIKYIRFDVLNTPNLASNNYVDLAYFGMCDTLEEICKLAADEFEEIDLVTGSGEYPLNTETCTPIIKTYIDPESDYTASELAYYSVVDTLNGVKLNACGNSAEGIVVKSDFSTPIPASVTMGGWAVAEGGIDCLVWSVDGGKTWHKISASLKSASDAIINHAQNKLSIATGTTFKFSDPVATKQNSAFQAPKLTLDLSQYAGQTVDFIFAAVPSQNTDTLCLLLCIEDLTITE